MISYKSLIVLTVIFNTTCYSYIISDYFEIEACKNTLLKLEFKSDNGLYNIIFLLQFKNETQYIKYMNKSIEINKLETVKHLKQESNKINFEKSDTKDELPSLPKEYDYLNEFYSEALQQDKSPLEQQIETPIKYCTSLKNDKFERKLYYLNYTKEMSEEKLRSLSTAIEILEKTIEKLKETESVLEKTTEITELKKIESVLDKILERFKNESELKETIEELEKTIEELDKITKLKKIESELIKAIEKLKESETVLEKKVLEKKLKEILEKNESELKRTTEKSKETESESKETESVLKETESVLKENIKACTDSLKRYEYGDDIFKNVIKSAQLSISLPFITDPFGIRFTMTANTNALTYFLHLTKFVYSDFKNAWKQFEVSTFCKTYYINKFAKNLKLPRNQWK